MIQSPNLRRLGDPEHARCSPPADQVAQLPCPTRQQHSRRSRRRRVGCGWQGNTKRTWVVQAQQRVALCQHGVAGRRLHLGCAAGTRPGEGRGYNEQQGLLPPPGLTRRRQAQGRRDRGQSRRRRAPLLVPPCDRCSTAHHPGPSAAGRLRRQRAGPAALPRRLWGRGGAGRGGTVVSSAVDAWIMHGRCRAKTLAGSHSQAAARACIDLPLPAALDACRAAPASSRRPGTFKRRATVCIQHRRAARGSRNRAAASVRMLPAAAAACCIIRCPGTQTGGPEGRQLGCDAHRAAAARAAPAPPPPPP